MHHAFTLSFFFNDTATTEIYTLSLHDALPISAKGNGLICRVPMRFGSAITSADRSAWSRAQETLSQVSRDHADRDRKSTRLNSSHQIISYAVFCLKKKNVIIIPEIHLAARPAI